MSANLFLAVLVFPLDFLLDNTESSWSLTGVSVKTWVLPFCLELGFFVLGAAFGYGRTSSGDQYFFEVPEVPALGSADPELPCQGVLRVSGAVD